MDSEEQNVKGAKLDWRLAALVIGNAAVFVFAVFATVSSRGGWGIAALSGLTLALGAWILMRAQAGEEGEPVAAAAAPEGEVKPEAPLLPMEEIESQSWEILHHLTTVNGYCDLLLHTNGVTAAEQRGDIAEIRYAGERALLSGLYLQWLMGWRQPRGQGISMNPLVLDLQSRLEAVLPGGVSLKLDLDPQAGVVVHDPDLLEWLITSLVATTNEAAVIVTTRAGTVEIQGGGSPEMGLALKAWEKLGGRVKAEGRTVSLSAPSVLAPLIAPKSTL